MSEGYFIHLFQTPIGKYFYDVNKNEIVEVDSEIYEYLEGHVEENVKIKVNQLQERGYLKTKRVRECKNILTEYMPDFINNRISYLVLQVTQMCNLRCEYCIYSGGYETRTHSNKRLNFDKAKKAIDFLIEHSFDEDTLDLGFYGGEPLLEFELIRKCVLYMKENSYGKIIRYHITTNATLLNAEIIEFLVSNEFSVIISLDGPREVHNRSRTFHGSGTGSFEVVEQNLKAIYKKYPKYYKEKISFNGVLTTQDGLSKIDNFFSNNKYLRRNMVTASLVSDVYAKKEIKINEQYIVEERYEEFLMFLHKIGWLKKEINFKIVNGVFGNILDLHENLSNYKRNELPDVWHHGGPCVPGVKRLFMNAEGKFYPCEKVSETCVENCIGDIENGLNVNKIVNAMNIGKCNHKICANCWLYSLCGICILSAEKMDKEGKKCAFSLCAVQRKETEINMINYTILKKLGYDFESNLDMNTICGEKEE